MSVQQALAGQKRKFLSERSEAMTRLLNNGQYWVFVLNNPERIDLPTTFKDVLEVHWQLESGTKCHTPHLQGVVKFRFPKGKAQVRAMAKAWWALMRGTYDEAKAYCTKEETRIAGPWRYTAPAARSATSEREGPQEPEQDTTSLPAIDSVSTANERQAPTH